MSVLDGIVARKRADVARRMEAVPYEVLREKAVPTTRRFGEALKKPGFRFILECKKASPSEGLIRKNFDIAEIAGVYGKFADAVSVLTDEPYFQGSFEYLRKAREILEQPILAKDFMTCPYQVCEARVHGADAVLLMMSVLDDETYRACREEAGRLGMDALTEAHDEAEVRRAVALGADIIGINNRDLKTLKVDLGTYSKLVDMIPANAAAVCESGIGSRDDALNLLKIGGRADAFLVGSLLMKAERLDLAVRRLIYGNVKICGLTLPEDAVKAYECGASFGGVIFAAESPRRVDVPRAREICAASPLPMVGVFVNEEAGEAARIASDLGLAAVQLHGDETDEFIAGLRERLPEGCEIWKARPMGGEAAGRMDCAADRMLFDTSGGSRGGTGKTFDWSLLDGFADKKRAILAGGLNPDNAFKASAAGYYAIDVNSGVEDVFGGPGKKNHGKITKLFENLRGGV